MSGRIAFESKQLLDGFAAPHNLHTLGNVPDSAWTFVVLTFSGSGNASKGYYNGTLDLSSTFAASFHLMDSTGTFRLGASSTPNNWTTAVFDEFRVATAVRSADWILAEYNNQNSPSTFSSLGTETAFNATPTPAPLLSDAMAPGFGRLWGRFAMGARTFKAQPNIATPPTVFTRLGSVSAAYTTPDSGCTTNVRDTTASGNPYGVAANLIVATVSDLDAQSSSLCCWRRARSTAASRSRRTWRTAQVPPSSTRSPTVSPCEWPC